MSGEGGERGEEEEGFLRSSASEGIEGSIEDIEGEGRERNEGIKCLLRNHPAGSVGNRFQRGLTRSIHMYVYARED